MWDRLIAGILLYGIELWGFQERAEVERLQTMYIKWILGLDIRTPEYIVLEETKRQRVISSEERIKESIGRTLVKECLKEKEEERQKTKSTEEREEYLIRSGLSTRIRTGMKERKKRQGNNREPEKERNGKTGPSAAQQNTKIKVQ